MSDTLPVLSPAPSAFDADGVQYGWDSTSASNADKCQRYYQLKREGWRRADESVHLWFGGIYAGALERFHKLCASGTGREEAIRLVVHWALVESWNHERDASGARIPGTGSAATFNHNLKSRDTLIRTIIWYFEDFAEDPFSTFLRQNGTAAVEASFQLPVDNGITLCGHIDRLAVDRESNIFVHDQKTSGMALSPYFFRQFKPGIQFGMYTFAGKAIYNVPVKGVIVDAVQVAVGFSKFARSPILYTEGELNEWYDELMYLVEETQENSRRDYFPRRPASCNNYGGCEFHTVCERPKEVRDNFLRADFVKGPRWDPFIPR